jgi:hypothetical protein
VRVLKTIAMTTQLQLFQNELQLATCGLWSVSAQNATTYYFKGISIHKPFLTILHVYTIPHYTISQF